MIRLTHANVWESMGKPCSCKRPILLQVTWESVSVLQVTRESVSGNASHIRWVWTCNEIEGSYDKIIITIVPSYTRKNITCLLPLALLLVLHTRNDTDDNKTRDTALYYDDTYMYIALREPLDDPIFQSFWCSWLRPGINHNASCTVGDFNLYNIRRKKKKRLSPLGTQPRPK